jgi:CHAD domain-containing protein
LKPKSVVNEQVGGDFSAPPQVEYQWKSNMSYRFQRSDSVQLAVRKVAVEQIDRAIGEIENESLDKHETVHQVRKRCKKIRGLIRLVRPEFDAYCQENEFFRDAARELSSVRDAQSMLECFDELTSHFREPLDPNAFSTLRETLEQRRRDVANQQMDLEQQLDRFLGKMRAAKARAESWQLSDGDEAAIRGGLKKTYRRARKGLRHAYQEKTAESFHEWRKRVKYHSYHIRLLRRMWPTMMRARRDAVSHLSDLLGDDHDLMVFHQQLIKFPNAYGSERERQMLLGLIERRSLQLRSEARILGERLFAEKPANLTRRYIRYWRIWKNPAR